MRFESLNHSWSPQTCSDEILPKETAQDTPQKNVQLWTPHASKRKSETTHAKPETTKKYLSSLQSCWTMHPISEVRQQNQNTTSSESAPFPPACLLRCVFLQTSALKPHQRVDGRSNLGPPRIGWSPFDTLWIAVAKSVLKDWPIPWHCHLFLSLYPKDTA